MNYKQKYSDIKIRVHTIRNIHIKMIIKILTGKFRYKMMTNYTEKHQDKKIQRKHLEEK